MCLSPSAETRLSCSSSHPGSTEEPGEPCRGVGGVGVKPSVLSSEEVLRGLFRRLPPSSTGLFSLLFFQDKELGSVKE